MARFADKLLQWYDRCGRKALPWRRSPDSYRIWVSEIMLQQTQVASAVPYYRRFIARFPNVRALADASLDEVLHLWSGLGYYARARNLHKAARLLDRQFAGQFPPDIEDACGLPGVGRSTAGAILAFAYGQRHPILDANVKRVLTRYHRVPGWPGRRRVENELWELARRHTPTTRVGDYTQAIMDLGATVCRRVDPRCDACPLNTACAAYLAGDAHAYPAPGPRRKKPIRTVAMIMIQNHRSVLLVRRPPAGVWGGLWAFPECGSGEDVRSAIEGRYGIAIEIAPHWDVLRHSFSHYHLDITPVPARLAKPSPCIMENRDLVWYKPSHPDRRGLAAPVKTLVNQLRQK